MTTTLSSRGQLVIPQRVRHRLGLRAGTRFAVKMERGNVVLAPEERKPAARLKRDRKCGLPTFVVPPGTPPMTSDFVRAALADFP
jgi:AbrB family looped-hinge helix DNA binding protein